MCNWLGGFVAHIFLGFNDAVKGNKMSDMQYVPQEQAMAYAQKIAEENVELLERLAEGEAE